MTTAHKPRVLVAAHGERVAKPLSPFLDNGAIEIAQNIEHALALLQTKFWDVGLIDFTWTGRAGGMQLYNEMRREDACGVILMSAQANQEERIAALEMGADDLVPRTIPPRELAARIRAITSRRNLAPPMHGPKRYHFGEFCLDVATRRLHGVDAAPRVLDPAEITLLQALVSRPMAAIAPSELLQRLRDHGFDIADLKRQVDELRAKMGPAGAYIVTRDGSYAFDTDVYADS